MDKPPALDRRHHLSRLARTVSAIVGCLQELDWFEPARRQAFAGRPRDVEDTPRTDLEFISRLLRPEASSSPAVDSSILAQINANQETRQLFTALSCAIVAPTQGYPSLSIADDLHWTDWSSVDLQTVGYRTVAATLYHRCWDDRPGLQEGQRSGDDV